MDESTEGLDAPDIDAPQPRKKKPVGGENKGSNVEHALRRDQAYEYYIRRMAVADIATKIGVSTGQVYRYIKERQRLNREAAEARGDLELALQEYIDAQNALIFKGWQILESPLLSIASQNVGTIIGHISQAEERKAKALGLLIDRSKIEAEVNGKMSLLDLMQAARERSGN